MRIGLRLLLGYFLVVAVAGYFIVSIFLQEVKPGVRRATEGTLIDTANILAQLVAADMQANNLPVSRLNSIFEQINRYPIGAKIDGIIKNKIEYRIYITDDKGIVMFDSARKDLAADYSRWNDVYLTLRGQYGARSTREDPDDPASSVMYVAAPIYYNNKIIGSLTVAKPNRLMDVVIRRCERRIEIYGLVLLAIALLIGAIFVWWINRSINVLVKYADQVAEGKKISLPQVNSPELSRLAKALESMRVKLEGKAYVEHYVHTLTHELKSPLAAIQGATEILQDDPPEKVKQHFLANIAQQNQRIQSLVDRLLQQARLESRIKPELSLVQLPALIESLLANHQARIKEKKLNVTVLNTQVVSLSADKLLLAQALNNLLDNALDFTPNDGHIWLNYQIEAQHCLITIQDSGSGIPEYALAKIFDRFYSLPRPDKDKSSGLGLNFVKEVALLHGGEVMITNSTKGGVSACLILPL